MHAESGAPVALKFFTKMEDYRRETALRARPGLDPRFVPGLLEAEESPEGLPPFVVTERGDFSLAELAARAPPPPAQQRIILHDLAAALAHLHALGVVAMAVEPGSLMFFGAAGAWKLVDWERWAAPGAPADIRYALRYAAPEVVAADLMGEPSVAAAPALDAWPLGVIAFEVLAGRRFYGGASDQEAMQALLGHGALPSEGRDSVLGDVADPDAQRMLRHLIRRIPAARWPAARVAGCAYFAKAGDFELLRVRPTE